jgi:hypothetical protein
VICAEKGTGVAWWQDVNYIYRSGKKDGITKNENENEDFVFRSTGPIGVHSNPQLQRDPR